MEGNELMSEKGSNKILIIITFILQALPIPISLISIIGSLISLANIGMAESTLSAVFAVITMLLAGTYAISYVAALITTIIRRKIHVYSFLPVIHLALTALFMFLWENATLFSMV